MQISNMILAAVAAFAAVCQAVPNYQPAVKFMAAHQRLKNVQYAQHVKFVGDSLPLQRRGGGGSSSSTKSTTTTPSGTTTTPTTTNTGLPTHTTPAGGLTYFGGPIVQNVEVTILTWNGAPPHLTEMQSFYSAVTQSSWFNIMRQYWTSTTSTIGSGKYIGTIDLTASTAGFPTTKSLNDTTDIQPFLRSLVKAGTIKPNSNSYFPIHFPSGISISLQGQGSCSAFCAYHNTIDISDLTGNTTQYLYYGVIPDIGSGACAFGCGSNFNSVNNFYSVSSHELAEMVTDPAIGVVVGDNATYPAAWYNQKNGENGDLCNGQQGSTVGRDGKSYTVQKIWSNIDNSCVDKSANSP